MNAAGLAMELLKPPDPLQLSGNLDANWRRFKQKFEIYLKATTSEDHPRTKEAKAALLLSIAGDEALEVFNNFKFEAGEDSGDYETLVRKFEQYCIKEQNEVHERYMFRIRQQSLGEPFENFLRDLKKQARQCNFQDLFESMVRDQIVFGINNDKLREKLLREKDLTLQKTEHVCKAAEAAALQREVWAKSEESVDWVAGSSRPGSSRTQAKKYRCRQCNWLHGPTSCPAYGKSCRLCNKKNHFAACCRNNPQVAEVNDDAADFDVLSVNACDVRNQRDWIVNAKVGNQQVCLKIDTGAQANLLPHSIYRKVRRSGPLTPTSSMLRAYNGGTIPHYGTTTQDVVLDNRKEKIKFFVVEHGRPAILGLQASEKLGIVTRSVYDVTADKEPLVSQFQNIFQGMGCVKQEYKMVLCPNAVPVVQPARRVPLALREPLRLELQRMESAGIIQRENGPTDWVSPLVIVKKKNGNLRLCMDPRRINECLKREHYQLPRREDIEGELADAQFFSSLDANAGFHQIPLDESSSKICTFGTPFGRYRYLRLPFGIASAPEVFQRTLSQIFEGLPGVSVYIDDILIWGRTKSEHDKRLKATLRAAELAGLTFNAEKCKIGVTTIEFLGDVISPNGIAPNPTLVSSLLQMPPPQNKQGVQRMLGVVTYFGKYLPSLSDRTKLLRSLIKNDTLFEWTPNHEKEWTAICKALGAAPLLAIFDPSKETKITCDASKDGLGAALLQRHQDNWRPVAYASRVLTQAEQRYAQIEKETLGITFGCEKFRQFVYGRKVIIETDHKPLVSISMKGIGDMPPRLQRFFLRLLQFDFTLQFVPGKDLVLADMLSRSLPGGMTDDQATPASEDVEVHAVGILDSLVTDGMQQRLVQDTARDEELRGIMNSLSTQTAIKGQWKPFTHELSVVEGILFKGSKVVIPRSLRPEILKRVHEGHLGISKCKARARLLVFWPGLNADIESMAQKCAICQKYAYRQQVEPLLMRATPVQPWYRVGVDLFQYGGASYLVVYDALSNFPEVERLNDTSSRNVIEKLKAIFSRYGVPVEVCSDNGPQFSSHDFQQFARNYEFKHTTSSPEFPRSNGLAEKGVQIVKRILKKTQEAHEDFWLGLLNYRASPLEDGRSPGELLQDRRLRTRLPDFRKQREISVKKHQQLSTGMPLQALRKGNVVRIRDKTWWCKARVLRQAAPRSYHVLTGDNKVLRRNRQHLLETQEDFEPEPSDTESDDCVSTSSVRPSSPAEEDMTEVQGTQPTVPEQSEGLATAPPLPRPVVSPRRSKRATRPPRRLQYDRQFNQVD